MILLDTHVWVWWLGQPDKLSENARKALEAAAKASGIYISSISVWEVALLVERKRLELTMELKTWLGKSEELPFISFIPVDNDIAYQSVYLPQPFHEDPADRIITATAIQMNYPLITTDKKILDYRHVETIW